MSGMGMLSDTDITAQLKLGKDADLQIDSPGKEDCGQCVTPVGYDVRAGDTLFSYDGKEVINFRNSEFLISPGDTVFISSFETFSLTSKIGGFSVSRLDPQLHGLQLSALSVDPGWQGELLIILTNVGREPVRVKHKQTLMTLCLFWMASPSSKLMDRARWNNNNVIEKFRAIEKGASHREAKARRLDLLFIVVLTVSVVWLRQRGFFETNVNSVMLWSSFTALYFSLLRRILFRLLRLPS